MRVPMGIKMRPMDFFVAFLVFLLGIYGFFDPDYPEKYGWPLWAIMLFEDIYLVIASGAIMICLVLREMKKCVVWTLVIEMFGWAFVSVASLVIAATSYWVPSSIFSGAGSSIQINIIWLMFWISLSIASWFRYFDMRNWYKGGHK